MTNDNDKVRTHATGENIEMITNDGLYFNSNSQFLLSLTKDGISARNLKISNLAAPTDDDDAVTKKYFEDEQKKFSGDINLNRNSIKFDKLAGITPHFYSDEKKDRHRLGTQKHN